MSENVTLLDNLKVLRSQICNNRHGFEECHTDRIEALQNCFLDNEIDAFEAYRNLILDFFCSGEIADAVLALFADKNITKCVNSEDFENLLKTHISNQLASLSNIETFSDLLEASIAQAVNKEYCDVEPLKTFVDTNTMEECKTIKNYYNAMIKATEPYCAV